MTAIDLEAIRSRRQNAALHMKPLELERVVREDVPALLAEVERLRAVDDDLSAQLHEAGGWIDRATAAEARLGEQS